MAHPGSVVRYVRPGLMTPGGKLPVLNGLGGGRAWRTLLQDTFTDTDGVGIDVHVPDIRPAGELWDVWMPGPPVINGNQVAGYEPVYYVTISLPTGQCNVRASVSVEYYASNYYWVGLLLRRGISTWKNGIGVVLINGNLCVMDWMPSIGFYVRASAAVAGLVNGNWYTVQGTCQGTLITGTCEGVSVSYTDTLNPTSTEHGVLLWRDTAGLHDPIRADNLLVEYLAAV